MLLQPLYRSRRIAKPKGDTAGQHAMHDLSHSVTPTSSLQKDSNFASTNIYTAVPPQAPDSIPSSSGTKEQLPPPEHYFPTDDVEVIRNPNASAMGEEEEEEEVTMVMEEGEDVKEREEKEVEDGMDDFGPVASVVQH